MKLVKRRMARLGALSCMSAAAKHAAVFPATVTAMPPTPFTKASSADALSINRENVHCYYSTVQSEVHPQELVDTALARRQARAVELHRRRRVRPARLAWVGLLVLVGLGLAAGVWLAR